ncbi:piggyBac transposable element-derived protein 4-like [Scomber japonicus]|uniref:piggyBac transposable element-derived protein 4-like n=1 Tax=Scomber japonicus TaxID=13676 RepID=UPI002305E5FF|nr:piggyBac transposable element-derived protein 4-like [Scomber japonicus]
MSEEKKHISTVSEVLELVTKDSGSAEIPINSESDLTQPEPDINGKDCLAQDTLMKDKIKDDDDEEKPDVGLSTSMAAPPLSESNYDDPIQPEPDINGKDCLVQDTLMKDKIKDDDDEEKPDVGPSTSVAAPPFLLKRSKSPRKSPRKSATVPQLPILESIPTQHEDEDMDDDDDDYVDDEDYTPATPMKRRRVMPVRVQSAEIPIDSESDYNDPIQSEPDINGKDCLVQDTLMKDKIKDDDDEKKPDVGPSTSMAAPPFLLKRGKSPRKSATVPQLPVLESIPTQQYLFFSTPVVRTIITNTNANAAKRLKAGLKFVWKRLTVSDFYIFLSIIIFTGLVKVHDRGDYWRKEWPYHFRFPANTMSRDRFECILWSLHMSDPAEDEENDRKRNTAGYDRLFRIKPLYTDIVNACQALFQPYRNIAIDERMVASKARISMKQYMKAKPIKWGYKLFVLADSLTAYTWNFFVYEGKTQMHIPGQGLSYTSVMNLMSFPLLGRGYTLFVDNFYSSPALFEELSRQNTGACGTIRKNLTSFPKTTHNDLPKNAKRGDMRWIRQNKLLFIKWMDTREVSVVSTVHKVFSGQTVKRRVKENGEWKITNVPIPDPILDYNHNMGGVDVSDALIGYYTVHHKTMKWYKTFFYHFMDIAVVNSFILYKELYKKKNPDMKKPLTQKRFREKLAAEMLEFAKASPSSPPSSPTPATTCMPAYYGDDGTQSRRYCKRCHDAGSKRVKTPLYCMKCQVPLCLTSKRNCFLDWHNSH